MVRQPVFLRPDSHLVIEGRFLYIFFMPTNVPPEYKKAEQAFRAAKTIDEKVERLDDMMALLPKHKTTSTLT